MKYQILTFYICHPGGDDYVQKNTKHKEQNKITKNQTKPVVGISIFKIFQTPFPLSWFSSTLNELILSYISSYTLPVSTLVPEIWREEQREKFYVYLP